MLGPVLGFGGQLLDVDSAYMVIIDRQTWTMRRRHVLGFSQNESLNILKLVKHHICPESMKVYTLSRTILQGCPPGYNRIHDSALTLYNATLPT